VSDSKMAFDDLRMCSAMMKKIILFD